MSDENERKRMMHSAIPADWDDKPMSLAHEIADLLKPVRDAGTSADSGGGNGMADLWVTVGGIEFFISIRRSNRQLAIDAGEANALKGGA